jgi:hypothetical protein
MSAIGKTIREANHFRAERRNRRCILTDRWAVRSAACERKVCHSFSNTRSWHPRANPSGLLAEERNRRQGTSEWELSGSGRAARPIAVSRDAGKVGAASATPTLAGNPCHTICHCKEAALSRARRIVLQTVFVLLCQGRLRGACKHEPGDPGEPGKSQRAEDQDPDHVGRGPVQTGVSSGALIMGALSEAATGRDSLPSSRMRNHAT